MLTIMPYQLGGFGNEEGMVSGAWWFSRKLGFEPRDPEGTALAGREEAAVARRASHRSSPGTLRQLARHNLFLSLGRPRADVIGTLDLANVGLHVKRFLACHFASDRQPARPVYVHK